MYQLAQAARTLGTWASWASPCASAVAASCRRRQAGARGRRRFSAFGFSGMEVETICRYKLPVCVVIFNNDGIYRGTDVNRSGGSDP